MSSTAGPHQPDPSTRPETWTRPQETGTTSGSGPDATDRLDTARDPDRDRDLDQHGHSGAVSAAAFGHDRHSVVDREKEEYGGVKIGSAFFGWLTATGTTVLLAAVLAGAGTAAGFASDTAASEAAGPTAEAARTAGIAGAIALLVILFIAYFCGGYVAGRMARFDGIKQGVAVWLWAIVIALVVAVLAAVAGDRFNVLAQLDSLPSIPVSSDDLTTGGIIAALAVAAVTLIGAVLGGLAGMRFHRKVDRAGLGN